MVQASGEANSSSRTPQKRRDGINVPRPPSPPRHRGPHPRRAAEPQRQRKRPASRRSAAPRRWERRKEKFSARQSRFPVLGTVADRPPANASSSRRPHNTRLHIRRFPAPTPGDFKPRKPPSPQAAMTWDQPPRSATDDGLPFFSRAAQPRKLFQRPFSAPAGAEKGLKSLIKNPQTFSASALARGLKSLIKNRAACSATDSEAGNDRWAGASNNRHCPRGRRSAYLGMNRAGGRVAI